MRELPCWRRPHRRERRKAAHAGRSRSERRVCAAERHEALPHDATARSLSSTAAPGPVLPRRQRRDARRRRQSLRQSPRLDADHAAEGGPGYLLEDAVAKRDATYVAE